MNTVKVIECPRDAMQGLSQMIPAKTKAGYINDLLKVGFDTIDFGSFVSPKAIPQLKDTAEVISMLDRTDSQTKLLAIVANVRGAEEALTHPEIDYLGFPFSISETFQQRNTNSSITESLQTVETIQGLCVHHNKKLVVYISMAFGNPYGDPWDTTIAMYWVQQMNNLGITTIAMSDTVGMAKEHDIHSMFTALIPEFLSIEFGAHLHCRPDNWHSKTAAAYEAGCRRFDSAIQGYGGCPMAEDELVGNLPTEKLLQFLAESGADTTISQQAFSNAFNRSVSVFAQSISSS